MIYYTKKRRLIPLFVTEVLPQTRSTKQKERPRFTAGVSTSTLPVLLKMW